jgi:integrase
MANRFNRVPSYRLHKPSGLAVVTLDGKDHYLGPYNTRESRAEYDRLIAEWLTTGRPAPGSHLQLGGPIVSEIVLAVWTQAEKHYRHPDGRPTGELDNIRDALRPLRRLYGRTPARDFGPIALCAVREAMVQQGLCRTTINARINRIRRVFRWAASMELIPASVPHALATVPALKRGRCDARESPGVKPVNWEHVEATLPHLPRPVVAMVEVMRYSNCRAEDVVIMRGCDLTMRGEIWEYRPASHKNQWREESSPIHRRIVCLGRRCQEIIRPFLQSDLQVYLFTPRAAQEEHRRQRAARRKTRRTPSELRRQQKAKPERVPGDRYSVNTFQQAVRRACRKVGIPAWTVLQVRHTRATEVREQYGVEGAQASLGNARVETAQIYAERNEGLARKIAREIG